MLKLAGYADRLSVRPGETIAFKVSSDARGPFSARLVRVVSADPNPAGPGIREQAVASAFEGTYPSRTQPVHRGSYARVGGIAALGKLDSFTVVSTIYPTLPVKGEQAIASWLDAVAGQGFALIVAADGSLGATAGLGSGRLARIATEVALKARAWHRVWATFDAEDGVLEIASHELGAKSIATAEASAHVSHLRSAAGRVTIAALSADPPTAHFNGKIEHPAIFSRALTVEEVLAFPQSKPAKGLVAHWDFAREIATPRIVDIGPEKRHGRLHNLPTRAMTGSSWNGSEMCWRHAPDQYAAIHFHEDDLYDCGWETDFAWTVPKRTRSGVYAVRLACGAEEENIPFYVIPPRGKRSADICLLASTFTYVVYHNFARPDWFLDPKWRKLWEDQAKAWGSYPHNPGAHRDYGWSTYNYHTDASGIAYASWLRPMLTFRSGYVTFPGPEIRGSGLRHYPADSHITAWLEAKGYGYDVVTDLELDEEGHELIAPYRVLLTGSHPEYHTPRMLDALTAYRDGGGRLMYLGGNGFYWKIARSKDYPAAIEIRRGEGGIRAWAAEAGEYYHAFDGEYGGLWRRNRRPPQMLTGVGFTAQGNFVGSYYRLRPEAASPRVAWILEGVAGDRIGDFGLSGHGAAGFELDRADKRLGTPEHAVVIGSSEGHDPEAPWVLVPEEQLTHLVTLPGEAPAKLIRADLTFFEAPNNGAVFSTGSITWCGSLPHNGFDNSVSRITQNVLDRFLDSNARFVVPE
jgi:N,N-dimethylformamidase